MKDNQAKYPQLRFKGFTDSWEQRKLGNYTTLITKGTTPREKSNDGNINFVKVENLSEGIINPTQKITETENNGYLKRSRLQQDDVLFSIAGTLGRTAIVTRSILPANTNQALAILRGYDFNQQFLLATLTGSTVKDYIRKNPTVGAQPNLSLAQLGNLEIETPSRLEQDRIGQFFNILEKTITLHQRKLAKLKELKQGYLQKLFPKNGSKFPQLRFAGFADAWEQRKLRGILAERNDQITETNEYPLMSFVQGKGVTPKGKRYNRSFLVKDVDKKYKKTELGDFIYSSNNLETGSIGFNRTGKAVISPVYSIFKSKREQESQFIGIMSARKDFIFKMIRFRQGVVYGQWRIHESDFLNIDIRIPSYEEQQSIICFFEKLNKAITLHQRKLEKLQELKKGYLQKMFC